MHVLASLCFWERMGLLGHAPLRCVPCGLVNDGLVLSIVHVIIGLLNHAVFVALALDGCRPATSVSDFSNIYGVAQYVL